MWVFEQKGFRREGVCKGCFYIKVENVLKGSLVSIPSPSSSVKIQIMGGKFC